MTEGKNTEAFRDVFLIVEFMQSRFIMAIIISEISWDAVAPFKQDQTDASNWFANFKHRTTSFQEKKNLAAVN